MQGSSQSSDSFFDPSSSISLSNIYIYELILREIYIFISWTNLFKFTNQINRYNSIFTSINCALLLYYSYKSIQQKDTSNLYIYKALGFLKTSSRVMHGIHDKIIGKCIRRNTGMMFKMTKKGAKTKNAMKAMKKS